MSAPVLSVVRSRRRRLLQIAVVTALLIAAFPVLRAYLALLRQREVQLAAAITDAGGKVQLRPPFRERMTALLKGRRVQGTQVFLGHGFDDEWVRRHDHLQDLNIQLLTIGEAELSGAGLAALLAEHPVTTLLANREELTDDAVAALADNGSLRELVLGYSTLTDKQLAHLPLEQLERLDIAGTRVTVDGLQELARCRKLRELDIDGRQFGPATVKLLNSLSSLERLRLCGSDVTDDHVKLLHGLNRYVLVTYWSTSTSEEARQDLTAVMRGLLAQHL
jgi:hypothetical protein